MFPKVTYYSVIGKVIFFLINIEIKWPLFYRKIYYKNLLFKTDKHDIKPFEPINREKIFNIKKQTFN